MGSGSRSRAPTLGQEFSTELPPALSSLQIPFGLLLQNIQTPGNLGGQDPGLPVHKSQLHPQGCSVSNPSLPPPAHPHLTHPPSPPAALLVGSPQKRVPLPRVLWVGLSPPGSSPSPPSLLEPAAPNPVLLQKSLWDPHSQAHSGCSFSPSVKMEGNKMACVDPEGKWFRKYQRKQKKPNSTST